MTQIHCRVHRSTHKHAGSIRAVVSVGVQSKTQRDFDTEISIRAVKAALVDLAIVFGISLPLVFLMIALSGGWE
jgi:hypothetical protein